MKRMRIGIAGLGTVGGEVAKLLLTRSDELAARAGCELDLVAVSARDRKKPRRVDLARAVWHDDPVTLARAELDVVVELIGGEGGPAHALVEAALKSGKSVVTANKAMLATHGAALAALAEASGAALKFEAAAAGGIPIVKALRESLIAYGIVAVRGILNGTCNYILTEMEKTGRSFEAVLKEAQEKGYAEADPTLDVGGGDTAHKLALLSALAFGVAPDLAQMSVNGITGISAEDIGFAREFGYRIKLLGVARATARGIDQRVEPAMVKAGTPLADVEGAFNAVVADAGEAGPFFFEGRGAGEAPTASAVIADIVDIARGAVGPAFGRAAASLRPISPPPPDSRLSAFYLRFKVLDVPGVLAEIAGTLAQSGVSIESMIQRARNPGEPVSIVMITHECGETKLARALNVIARSDKVVAAPCMIPMEAG